MRPGQPSGCPLLLCEGRIAAHPRWRELHVKAGHLRSVGPGVLGEGHSLIEKGRRSSAAPHVMAVGTRQSGVGVARAYERDYLGVSTGPVCPTGNTWDKKMGH